MTAPHAVRHRRQGRWKYAEPATAELARGLHSAVGVHALIKNDADFSDPNSDESSPFRDAAVELAARESVVAGVDLHEMSPSREQAVILGTGCGRNIYHRWHIRDIVVEEFSAAGFAVLVDEVFPAMGLNRVSSDVSRRAGIPYVQLELNPALIGDVLPGVLRRIVVRLAAEAGF